MHLRATHPEEDVSAPPGRARREVLRVPVSVIIPTYRQTALVRACVASLAGSKAAEILVVDDGSPLDVQEALRSLPCAVVCQEQNGGFAAAVSEGMRRARPGHDLVILNSDVEARPNWLETLRAAAYQAADIGIVGPKLLYPNGAIQSAGSCRNVLNPEWFDHRFRYRPADFPAANVAGEVGAVTGACMYVKRDVVNAIGGFDERFPLGFEDVDYCLRARRAEFRIVYCPQATLTHYESATRGRGRSERELRSKTYFWETWSASREIRALAFCGRGGDPTKTSEETPVP